VLTPGRIHLIAVTALVVAGAFAVEALGAGTPAAAGWDGTLQYTTAQAPAFPRVLSLRLRVTRSGVVVYNRAVALPRACVPDGCRLAAVGSGRPFQLVYLGVSKGPTALIWLWTGGAHCCTVLRAVSIPDGAVAAKNFGNFGARLTELHASRVFVSADDRFAYLFTSFAASAPPIQIWRFRNGRFSDVTRMSPEQITADAARWWKLIQKDRRLRLEARGVFAAWAADTCALGQPARVRRELAIGVAAGVFSPPRGEPDGLAGAQYAAALQRKLTAWGYCR
jgi:hypothetical protein